MRKVSELLAICRQYKSIAIIKTAAIDYGAELAAAKESVKSPQTLVSLEQIAALYEQAAVIPGNTIEEVEQYVDLHETIQEVALEVIRSEGQTEEIIDFLRLIGEEIEEGLEDMKANIAIHEEDARSKAEREEEVYYQQSKYKLEKLREYWHDRMLDPAFRAEHAAKERQRWRGLKQNQEEYEAALEKARARVQKQIQLNPEGRKAKQRARQKKYKEKNIEQYRAKRREEAKEQRSKKQDEKIQQLLKKLKHFAS